MPAKPHPYEDKILLVLTLVIGALVGLAVVLFIVLTENLGGRLYPAESPAWRRVLIPIAGSLIAGFLLNRYFSDARGSGIPQTKEALFLHDGHISFRTVLAKFGLCSLSLASGIALGREGPSVHVGAGIASTLGRKLRLSGASIKALIPTGASAALAAAFNTPISAVLFSLEEVMGDMHAPVLGSVVLSSATSWIVLHLILGDEPLFHVPAYQLVHPVEFIFYAALGLLGGLASVGFVKLLLWQRKRFRAAPRAAAWAMPAVGGVTVGLLGWFYPAVLGVGYAYVGDALNGRMAIGTMALLVVLKIVATSTCYASGNAGGVFGPSLFIGAMLGGAVGGVAHIAAPDYTGSAGAYALVGMGAAFAGIIRVPLTSVIMIFEITRDYSIIVPLMIANLMSYFISSRLQKEPIYEALQHQDGVHLPSGARARETLLTVGHAHRPEAQAVAASETVGQVMASVDRERGAWPVVDGTGLCGVVTLDQLEAAMREGRAESPVAAVLKEDVATLRVHIDDPLESAMRRLAPGRVKLLPVVSRTNLRELKGVIALSDVLAAYALSGAPAQEEAPRPGMRLLAGVLAAVVGVAALGVFLSYYYRAERGRRAEEAYELGKELSRKDRLPEAIEQYRYALSVSHRPEHRLALAQALVRAERTNEAAIYLNEILRSDPNSGPANLAMAEALAAQGRFGDAALEFRRAIAGVWPDRSEDSVFRARRGLAQALEKAGKPAEARAELLTLAANLPLDSERRKETAGLLLEAGLTREAATLYREMTRDGPPDAEEFGGLGEALFREGNYRAAAQAFRKAVAADEADDRARSRLELLEAVVALDPTQRGLRARERYRRSQELLRQALTLVEACAPAGGGEAKAALSRAAAPRSFSDAADANLALAEKVWSERGDACKTPEGNPAAVILGRLGAG